jgi:hypothetical protein
MITDDQKQIVGVLVTILRHTSDIPVKGKVIEQLTGVDDRLVAEMNSFFYREGLPVGSGSNGYFQTRGPEERKAQYLREINRGKNVIQKAVQGRKAQATVGELTLFEVA